MSIVDIKVPALGESVTEATLNSWSVAVGDTVKMDQTLCELDSDKASVEVPAEQAGTIVELLAEEGDDLEGVVKEVGGATVDEEHGGQQQQGTQYEDTHQPLLGGVGQPVAVMDLGAVLSAAHRGRSWSKWPAPAVASGSSG